VKVRHPLVGPVTAVDLYRHTMPVCQPPKTPSYIVYRLGDTFYAENTARAVVEFEDDDAATVIQAVLNALPYDLGGAVFLKRGVYPITSQLTVPPKDTTFGKVTIRGEGRWSTALIAEKSISSILRYDPDVYGVTLADMGLRSASKDAPEAGKLVDASRPSPSNPRRHVFCNVAMRHAATCHVDLTNSEAASFIIPEVGVPADAATYGIFVDDINGNLYLYGGWVEAKTSPIYFRSISADPVARPALYVYGTVVGGEDASTNKGITVAGNVVLVGDLWCEKPKAYGITGELANTYRPDIAIRGRMNNPIQGYFRTVRIKDLQHLVRGIYHTYVYTFDVDVEADIDVVMTGITALNITGTGKVKVKNKHEVLLKNYADRESYLTMARGAGTVITGNPGTAYAALTASELRWYAGFWGYIVEAYLYAAWNPMTAAGGLRLWNATDGVAVATLEPGVVGYREDRVDITDAVRGWTADKFLRLETKGDGTTAPTVSNVQLRITT